MFSSSWVVYFWLICKSSCYHKLLQTYFIRMEKPLECLVLWAVHRHRYIECCHDTVWQFLRCQSFLSRSDYTTKLSQNSIVIAYLFYHNGTNSVQNLSRCLFCSFLFPPARFLSFCLCFSSPFCLTLLYLPFLTTTFFLPLLMLWSSYPKAGLGSESLRSESSNWNWIWSILSVVRTHLVHELGWKSGNE